jgi:drug/metabolite transporter (DMT)-like permease
MQTTQKKSYLYIIIAAALWGGIGVFVKLLSAAGFSSLQIVAIRVVWAAVALALYLVCTGRGDLLKIKLRDCGYFIGTGIFSLTFFNWCSFNAIEQSSMAIAAVLLYTSPVWIVLLAAIFFHEKLTGRKILAVGLTLLGCALVVGLLGASSGHVSPQAVLLGLGSGFGYALYSIFGKFALKKYSPETVSAYTFIFAVIGSVPLALREGGNAAAYFAPKVLLCGAGIGVLCCVLPFIFYTKGLLHVEAGKAGILATVEPAVATLLSVLLYDEVLSADKLIGMALIFIAIVLLNHKENQREDGAL